MTAGAARRLLYWVVSLSISAVLLYFALRGVDWHRVWQIITHANLLLVFAGLALISWSSFVRSLRWRILLNAEGRFSIPTVFWATMAGYLGNSVLPARAGEVLRTVLISNQSTLSKAYVLTTALGERMMDVIALVLAGAIALMGVHPQPAWMHDVSRGMAAIAIAGALFVVIVPHTGRLLESILKRLPMPGAVRPVLLRLTEQILLGVRAFHDWRRLGSFSALTVVIWLSDGVATVVGGQALGVHISFPVAMLLLTGLGLGSALPSTPGYVGVYQFVAITTLTPFGISRDAALAYILTAQAMNYVLVMMWGLPGLYLLRRRRPA